MTTNNMEVWDQAAHHAIIRIDGKPFIGIDLGGYWQIWIPSWANKRDELYSWRVAAGFHPNLIGNFLVPYYRVQSVFMVQEKAIPWSRY